MTSVGEGQGKLETKKELKKHAAIIHCSNTLTLLQRKISNALLFHAYPKLMEEEEHEITVRELCQIIDYQGNNHGAIKDALKQLISTVLEWNIVDDSLGEEEWTASSIIASVRIKGPLCSYAYSPRMKALLHSPQMYGKINLIVQSHFKSSYGLAMYENCVRYQGLPYTKWFDLALFRKLMGVPDDKYPIFRDLKKRVIDKSVEEVNTFSDLFIEPEIKREGRKVSKIRLKLQERPKKKRIGIGDQPARAGEGYPTELINKLTAVYGLNQQQIRAIAELYQVDFVLEKIALVEATPSFVQGQIRNLAGYLMNALKSDYQQPRSSQEHANKIIEQKRVEEGAEQHRKQAMETLKNDYTAYVSGFVDDAVNGLEISEYDDLLQAFAASLEADQNRVVLNRFQKEGLNNTMVRGVFRSFVKTNRAGLLDGLIAFDEFENQVKSTG